MRISLWLLPVAMVAAPANAQKAAPAAPTAEVDMQRVLADPATADRLAQAMQVMSKIFLQLPAGEIEAALEGRQPTAAEKKMTVRDMGRSDDPKFDRDFQRQMADTRPMIQQSMKALSAVLPAMMRGMGEATKELDKATANLPSPTYPKQ